MENNNRKIKLDSLDNKTKLNVSVLTFDPYVIVSRCVRLLDHFNETYIDDEEARERLSFDALNRHGIPEALLYSLREQLARAEQFLEMLQKIQKMR